MDAMKTSVPNKRNAFHPIRKKPRLDTIKEGARVAVEWGLLEFQKIISRAEAEAHIIITNAKTIEEKTKRKRQKAKDALENARHEAAMIIEDAEDLANDIVTMSMEDADRLCFEAQEEAWNIKMKAIESSYVDLTNDD